MIDLFLFKLLNRVGIKRGKQLCLKFHQNQKWKNNFLFYRINSNENSARRKIFVFSASFYCRSNIQTLFRHKELKSLQNDFLSLAFSFRHCALENRTILNWKTFSFIELFFEKNSMDLHKVQRFLREKRTSSLTWTFISLVWRNKNPSFLLSKQLETRTILFSSQRMCRFSNNEKMKINDFSFTARWSRVNERSFRFVSIRFTYNGHSMTIDKMFVSFNRASQTTINNHQIVTTFTDRSPFFFPSKLNLFSSLLFLF